MPDPTLIQMLQRRLGYTQPPARPTQAPEVTPLQPDQVPAFVQWLINNRVRDLDDPQSHYDYRGAYLAGLARDPGEEGHFPDTFKQHGHPTFSDESQYSRGYGDGGHWIGETYIPQERVVGARVSLPPVLVRGTPTRGGR
jgi:hypothetical protein